MSDALFLRATVFLLNLLDKDREGEDDPDEKEKGAEQPGIHGAQLKEQLYRGCNYKNNQAEIDIDGAHLQA